MRRNEQNFLTRSLVNYTNITSNITFQAASMDTGSTDTASTFGFEDLVTFALTDMAKAMSERNGESEAQQLARCEAAVHMIMAFAPRDVIEVMLAGHCVMLHEVMTVDVRDSLCGEAAGNRRSVVVLNRAFNDNLERLERYRQRPAASPREALEVCSVANVPAAPVEPVARSAMPEMNRAARRQAARAAEMRAAATASRPASRQGGKVPTGATRTASPQAAPHPEGNVVQQPTDEAVAKCRGNPEAMAALAAGDPAGFARALGIATPGEAFLAAAKSPGSPFDQQAFGPWPVAADTRKG
jgi:hypothetical protein